MCRPSTAAYPMFATPPTPRLAPARRRRGRLALAAAAVLAALVLYVPGLGGAPLFDRDEPRYAITSLNMLRTGDLVLPQFLGKVRTAKPPATYWAQAAAMRLFGPGDFAARLPSALAAAATLGLLAWVLPTFIGLRRAAWACLILGGATLFVLMARWAITDMLLLLCVTGMQLCLVTLYVGRAGGPARGGWRGVALLMWLCVGAGGLVKGPVVLGILATTLVALWVIDGARMVRREGNGIASAPRGGSEQRLAASATPERGSFVRRLWRGAGELGRATWRAAWVRPLRPVLGVLVVALVTGPWLVLVSLRSPDFLATAIGHDVISRSTRGLESHGLPPGFHLLALTATWWPWSILLPAAIGWALGNLRRPHVRFALAAAVGPWVMFELVATKLPHYLLPVFPWLALLTAGWLVAVARRPMRWGAKSMAAAGLIVAVVGAGLALAPWPVVRGGAGYGGAALHAVAVLACAGLAGWWWWRRRLMAGTAAAAAMMPAVALVGFSLWLATVPMLSLSRRAAEAVVGVGRPERVNMLEYKEPSLGWYLALRGIEAREGERQLLDAPPAPGAWVVTTSGHFDALGATARSRWEVAARVPGTLYNERFARADVLVLRPRR